MHEDAGEIQQEASFPSRKDDYIDVVLFP